MIYAATALALLIGSLIVADARAIVLRGRWVDRRRRVLNERAARDDTGYADELAVARVMMRPSFPAPRNVHPLSDRLGVHSVRVKP